MSAQFNLGENAQNQNETDDISELDRLYPRANQELLDQMRRDRQEELNSRSNFNKEKEQRAQTLATFQEPQASAAPGSSERKENSELEEMTLEEVGVPRTIDSPFRTWKSTHKINEEIEVNDKDNSSVRTYLLDQLYVLVSLQGRSWENLLYNRVLNIVATAHRKDKKGCDVNKTCKLYSLEENSNQYALYTPLKFAITLAKENPESAYDPRLIQDLITAGARFDNIERTALLMYIKSPFKADLPGHPSEELNFLTPLDVLMFRYNDITPNGDGYDIRYWRSTDPIPVDLQKPAFRVFLKALYLQTEFVEDHPEISEKDLNEIFARQSNNILTNPLNALIFSYAAPQVADVNKLSCLKREPLFFRNVFAIGKRLFEADRLPEDDQNGAKQRETQRVRV